MRIVVVDVDGRPDVGSSASPTLMTLSSATTTFGLSAPSEGPFYLSGGRLAPDTGHRACSTSNTEGCVRRRASPINRSIAQTMTHVVVTAAITPRLAAVADVML